MAYLRPSLGLLSCVSTLALHVAGPNAEKMAIGSPTKPILAIRLEMTFVEGCGWRRMWRVGNPIEGSSQKVAKREPLTFHRVLRALVLPDRADRVGVRREGLW